MDLLTQYFFKVGRDALETKLISKTQFSVVEKTEATKQSRVIPEDAVNEETRYVFFNPKEISDSSTLSPLHPSRACLSGGAEQTLCSDVFWSFVLWQLFISNSNVDFMALLTALNFWRS